MNNQKVAESNVDKIDVEELIKDYRVYNLEVFIGYLRDVWRVRNYLIFRIYHKEATKNQKE